MKKTNLIRILFTLFISTINSAIAQNPMLKSYHLSSMAIIIAMNLLIAAGLSANWKKIENESSFQKREVTYQNESTDNKSDSLPQGVTRDWLNSLLDENGNRIIPQTGPGIAREIPEEPDFLRNEIVPDITMTGEATWRHFGISVSSAGDVNSDGYSDVIVGAPLYSQMLPGGRAYIYFGGASMNNVADVTLARSGGDFGQSVSTAGDVNGDGYSDVIVGEPEHFGRAYIYFGGAPMNNSADVTLISETIDNSFGWSVSSAGDVNGDEYSDVIVGAYGAGKAYIYFGGASMNNSADVTMTSGWSVSSAGDVNDDGYSDVIAGDLDGDGRAYIYFGGASMNNVADVTMTGGYSVSSAGDVNDDGYSDVIVGAYDSTSTVYIYFGGAPMNNVADVTMTGGYSVSSAGDINGDRYSDVIVGDGGRAYIYFGGASMNNVADVTITGEVINDDFGNSVSSAGDVNGDGYSDVIVGEPDYSSGTGRADIYLGSAISQGMTLNLTTFIEGFYNAGSNSQVSDTITVELRNSTSPYAVADVAEAVVSSNGSATLKFTNAASGNYYIAIKHRNSIETWSTNAISFSQITPVSYDFSTASSQAFRSNMIQVDASPVRFADYSGDVNQDGVIDLSDLNTIYNAGVNFATGYLNTDLSGDGIVDLSDLIISYINGINFVVLKKP